jgi:hypothetical protein
MFEVEAMTFDWLLFGGLVLVCVPGVVIVALGTLPMIERRAQEGMDPGRKLPPRAVLVLASTVQSLLLVAVAAAVGTLLTPTIGGGAQVGLGAPAFEALAAGEPVWPAIRAQLVPALVVGVAGALLFVAAYYRVFRPRLDDETVLRMEELRNGLGIWGRVLYGGVVEEILIRWGLMSLLVWLGSLVVGSPTPAVVWTAIVVAGVAFGLGHAPGYLAAGCKRSPAFFAAMISLNLWASLIFGWLFWQYGLLAAMLGHVLFHLVWWPFDLKYYVRPAAEAAG